MTARPLARLAALGCLALGAGCHTPATAMELVINSDMTWGPGQQLTSVELSVYRGGLDPHVSNSTPVLVQTYVLGQSAGTFTLPGTRVLERRGPVDVPVWVEAAALHNGVELFRTHAIARFAEQQTVVLDLYLAARCSSLLCPAGQVCGRSGDQVGVCIDEDRGPLPAIDAGPEAAAEASVALPDDGAPGDAGVDAPYDITILDDGGASGDSAVDASGDAPRDGSAPMDSTVVDVPVAPDALVMPDALAMPDAPVDARADAVAEVSVPTDAASTPVRLLAPLSGSTVSSSTPTLRVAGSTADVPGSPSIQLCRDRALTLACVTQRWSGGSLRVASPLASGTWFWRVVSGATGYTAVWQFVVPRHPRATDLAYGIVPDFNGDGLADVLVAAPSPSRLWVFPGTTGTFSPGASPPATVLSSGGSASFGNALGAAGDVNGDGFVDALVADSGSQRVTVYFGSPAGLTASSPQVVTSTLGGFGAAAAGVGDVNGDGYGDVAVGAPNAPWSRGSGEVALFAGGPSGLGGVPVVLLTGDAGSTGTGATVALAGDLNGDGMSDLAAAAPSARGQGIVFLYFGASSWPAVTPAAYLAHGGTPVENFGSVLAFGGDLDGDGRGDLVTGASSSVHLVGPVMTNEPFVAVVRGVAMGSTPALSAAWTFVSPGPDDEGFASSVAAGDLDGDGYGDLLVGAPQASSGTGKAYLLHLNATGPGSPSSTVYSSGAGNAVGARVANAGDVNGDGIDDPLVGDATQIVQLFLGATLNFTGRVTLSSSWSAGPPIATRAWRSLGLLAALGR